jgi:hypothetical protein
MTTINGLPAHALLVHVVVVFIPLAAVLLVVMAFWPQARRRLSVFTAIIAGVALVSVPLTTEAGDWLEHRVPPSTLVRAHTRLGDTMLPWAIGLFVLAAAVAVHEILRSPGRTTTSARTDHPGAAHAPVTRAQTTRGDGSGGRAVSVVIAVLALVVAAGSIFTVYKIGDSGARAAWTERLSEHANPPHPRTQTSQGLIKASARSPQPMAPPWLISLFESRAVAPGSARGFSTKPRHGTSSLTQSRCLTTDHHSAEQTHATMEGTSPVKSFR